MQKSTISKEKIDELIIGEQKNIDFDTKEYTVELLVDKFRKDEFYIPSYQREYVWHAKRKSRLIESILIGLPIPFLFCAEMDDGRLEIVDGAQRIQTVEEYICGGLILNGLEKLHFLNKMSFDDLSIAQQRKFRNRTIRMVVISEKAAKSVRFDIFERINTGSDNLKHSELRRGLYLGPFSDLMRECAGNPLFRKLCPINEDRLKRGEDEELVLRFFVYSDHYLEFKHSVEGFLGEYTKLENQNENMEGKKSEFERMLKFVNEHFPSGFAKSETAKSTPRVRFEAIAVGVNLALRNSPGISLQSKIDMSWLDSDKFKELTTSHASNSGPKLRARIEFVRDSLLGAAK